MVEMFEMGLFFRREELIYGRVRASGTKMVDSGSIPGRVKPKDYKKLVFTASLLDVQQLKGQCEASTVCGRQVGRWQLDSKTERSLPVSWPRQLGEKNVITNYLIEIYWQLKGIASAL